MCNVFVFVFSFFVFNYHGFIFPAASSVATAGLWQMINSIIETRTKNVTHAHKKDAFCAARSGWMMWVGLLWSGASVRQIIQKRHTHTQTCTYTHVNSQERQPQQVQVTSQIKDMLLSLLLLFVLASPGMSSWSVGVFNPAFNLICKLLCVCIRVVVNVNAPFNDYIPVSDL